MSDTDGRELLLQRAENGGVDWAILSYIWPTLNACDCQGHQDGIPCVEIRREQVEALFAEDKGGG